MIFWIIFGILAVSLGFITYLIFLIARYDELTRRLQDMKRTLERTEGADE